MICGMLHRTCIAIFTEDCCMTHGDLNSLLQDINLYRSQQNFLVEGYNDGIFLEKLFWIL
jgi:hypothetical protein